MSRGANIEHFYFEGMAVTGIQFPNGGILKSLHLPETITNLTARNQTAIADFVISDYNNISTLRLENVSVAFDKKSILHVIPVGTHVRVMGFAWAADSAEDILSLYDRLGSMRSLEENGGNVSQTQIGGTITVETLLGSQYPKMLERYPNFQIQYATLTAYLYYLTMPELRFFNTKTIVTGRNGHYETPPSKASTAQYSYSFTGWSKTQGGTVDADVRRAVVFGRNVYAVFKAALRKYTVRFYNENTQTVKKRSLRHYSRLYGRCAR